MKSGAQDVVETQAGSGFRAWGPGLCGMLVVIALLAGSSRPAGAAMRTPLEVPRKAADRSAASNQENPSPAPLVIESLPVSVEPFAPSYHPQAPVPIVIDLEGGAGASIDLAWNADPACFDGIEAGAAAGAPEDLDGFSDLVAILSAERIIDPSRIYVSGPTDALAPPACVPIGPIAASTPPIAFVVPIRNAATGPAATQPVTDPLAREGGEARPGIASTPPPVVATSSGTSPGAPMD